MIIETADVRKTYGSVEALAGLALRVPRGAICGLLGRNGAGKTTTIKVLLGMVRPTSGDARVFGLKADDSQASVEIRSRTAFVSEDKDLYAGMTVAALVRFTAAFYPKWRADLASTYLEQFELRSDATIKQSLARHANQARVAAGSVDGCRAVDSGRADVGARSGGDGGDSPDPSQASGSRRNDGAVLVAPTRARRAR